MELAAPKRQRAVADSQNRKKGIRIVQLYPFRMKKLTKEQILDFKKFYVSEVEAGFSPERNKKIIEDTITAYEREKERRQRLFGEQLDERSDAVSHFLKALDTGKTTTALRYFGKKELARLRGEEILGELKTRYAKKKPKN